MAVMIFHCLRLFCSEIIDQHTSLKQWVCQKKKNIFTLLLQQLHQLFWLQHLCIVEIIMGRWASGHRHMKWRKSNLLCRNLTCLASLHELSLLLLCNSYIVYRPPRRVSMGLPKDIPSKNQYLKVVVRFVRFCDPQSCVVWGNNPWQGWDEMQFTKLLWIGLQWAKAPRPD